jgi:hypothetical protein
MPEFFAPAHLHPQIVDLVVAAAIPAAGAEAMINDLNVRVPQGTDYRGVYAAYRLALEDFEAALANRIDWACMYSPT